MLTPVALFFILGYSYTKRLTPLCHLFLGASIGIAPTAAWVAITGRLDALPLILTGVVATWVAGFDIIYACQDVEYDRSDPRVHSLPKWLGVRRALQISVLLHAGTVAFLLVLPLVWPMNVWYYTAVGIVAVLLVIEHAMVQPTDLSRAGQAFWVINGWVGFILLGGMLASLYL
jgi:4-hydroxybenzoate polyprenyltransferase